MTRFQTKDKPSTLERWEAKWVLKWIDADGSIHKKLVDQNGQGQFWLSSALIENTNRIGDMLVWKRPNDRR